MKSLKPRDLAFTAGKFADISFRFSEISSNFRELKNSLLRYFVSLCEFSRDLAKFRRTFVELSRERCKSSHEISPIFRRKFARTIDEIRRSSLLLLLHSTVVPGLSECPYRLLSLQKQSRVYFNVTLPPKNAYYPNTCHVGKHNSK